MNNSVRVQHLRRLKQATNQALEVARGLRNTTLASEPVNWAALRCTQAMYRIDDDGSESYGVIVEEASPESRLLGEVIAKYLFDNGFLNVEVVTEW